MSCRFHVLGVPHTVSTPAYSGCAFTQKVVRLCRLLTDRGHDVTHYGHAISEVACREHVAVTDDNDLVRSYGAHDWLTQGPPRHTADDPVHRTFTSKTIEAIRSRKRPGDFLLCPYGAGHKSVADANSDLIVCESGIGYGGGGFAPFRVFESYAVLHAYLGTRSVESMNNGMWYDAVIPNCYDPNEFAFGAVPNDYFLFLGRIDLGKGITIALQIVEALGARLVVAGPGKLSTDVAVNGRPLSDYVDFVGYVGPERRRELLSQAKALLAPSVFVEPFCGAHVEAMMSGTPVVTSDFGAFTEYNLHGTTGFRCRTFEQFVWAARNIGAIDRRACRSWAERTFSMERVGAMYDEYFFAVRNVFEGKGWYAPNPVRNNLDWLTTRAPIP